MLAFIRGECERENRPCRLKEIGSKPVERLEIMSNDGMPIIEDRASPVPIAGLPPWQLLIVDDDESVHRATRFALDDFSFEDRPLEITSAFSAKQARELIVERSDVAVVLLDVVMETEFVGLDFVRWVRDELSNPHVRIVMRTGQPGFAPELQVIRDYDINDYKEKSELTNTKLLTTIYAALRAFRDIVRLEKKSDALREALVAVEEANLAKMSFISHMSHEFRTPLNGIIGLSEMIASEALGPVGTEKYREYAWDIVTSGKQLQTMVESVLEITEKEQPLVLSRFDLYELLDEFKRGYQSAPGRTKEPRKTGTRLMIRADRNDVIAMLGNLVTNAVSHNRAGCKVRITAQRRPDGGLALSVIDDGDGIPQDVIDRLGEPFNLMAAPYLAGTAGMGLGLMQTRRLIERHGGTMAIETEAGHGTTVRLNFPPDNADG